jgi:hypothetical protein
MKQPLTFLFYHYGKIPRYLRNAIEQVRIFNPQAEIMLITDGIGDVSMLKSFGVRRHEMADFPSPELETFRRTYRHISCFKEKYERFVLERWFVTETIRRQRPERTYIMQDSDVAVFGDASKLISILPDRPICLASMNPHFTFIRGSVSRFLQFILRFYGDEALIAKSVAEYERRRQTGSIFTQGEMQFLFDYHPLQEDMVYYPTETSEGFVDVNIHLPQGCDSMKLRRRSRKKIRWVLTQKQLTPHFLRNGVPVRAFLVHFQGPGKRVFWRFCAGSSVAKRFKCAVLNLLFQKRCLANLT